MVPMHVNPPVSILAIIRRFRPVLSAKTKTIMQAGMSIKVSLYFQSILYVKNIFLGYKFRAKMVPKHGHYNSHLRALI